MWEFDSWGGAKKMGTLLEPRRSLGWLNVFVDFNLVQILEFLKIGKLIWEEGLKNMETLSNPRGSLRWLNLCIDFNIVQILEFLKCGKLIRGGGLKKNGGPLGTKRVSRVVECVCRFEYNSNS